MEKVTLLYEGDEKMASDSLILLGVFTDQSRLLECLYEHVKERIEEDFITDDAKTVIEKYVRNGNKTRGYDTNFIQFDVNVNELSIPII